MNRVVLVALVWWGLLAGEGDAYVQLTTEDGIAVRQEDGRAVVNPQVGCPTGRCFNQAVREAAAEWNRTGARFVYRFTNDPTAQVECEARDVDEIITVRWAAVHCGEEWGEETLAMAPLWYATDGSMAADIVFNPTYTWDVYDGPLVSGRQDFRRVVLHELGHTLGLDHPDDYGQTVRAIMNSRAGDTDRLQADDIAGIRAIYGRTQQTQTKGALENPGPSATKTGIGIISGWVCDATQVEVEVKGARFAAAYGTDRGDTRSACGDADNGFVVLVNWNNFGVGTHRIRLLADGRELVSRLVTVKTYGTDFLQGKTGRWTLEDWPAAGTETILGWTEGLQNIEIVDIRRGQGSTPPPTDLLVKDFTTLQPLLGTWRFTSSRGVDVLTLHSLDLTTESDDWSVAYGETTAGDWVWGARNVDAVPDYTGPHLYYVIWRGARHCVNHDFNLTSATTAVGITYRAQRVGEECQNWSAAISSRGVRTVAP